MIPRKPNVLFILAFLLPVLLSAQTEINPANPVATEPAQQETPSKLLRVMVIPFHPMHYYFSDCDKSLSPKSKIDVQDIRNNFRSSLDFATEEALEEKYDPINILQLKDSVSKEMLEKFYSNVTYAYATPSGTLPKKQEKELQKFRESLSEANLKPLTGAKPGSDEECYTQIEKEDKEYMRAAINPEFLETMNELFHPDMYVTINQFEVKTDYERCIDRDLGRFTRRIKVHYNVFNAQGKLIYGDVVTAKYNSTNDDLRKIVTDNFGFLAEYITRSIP